MKKIKNNFSLLVASLVITCVVVVAFSCDSRKDYYGDLSKSQSVAPIITLRRMNSGNPYVAILKDTFLLGTVGYKLQYEVTGSYTPASVKLVCQTNCDSLVSIAWHQDSSYFLVFIKPSSTVSFDLSCSNKYNQSSTAHFTLTYKNAKPVVNIRRFGSSNVYTKNLSDSCLYAISPIYNIDYTYSDDNSTWSNLQVLKGTSGDPSVITIISGKISINYGSFSVNKTFLYKIFGKDPLNVTSDTAYATIVYNNKAPQLYIVNSTNNNVLSLIDTLKTTISPTYSLNIKIFDETATISNMVIIKSTVGDLSTITKSGNTVLLNYSSATMNKKYNYKFYVTDPQSLVSDTCYFSAYVFKNRPPVFVSLVSAATGTYATVNSSTAPYLYNSSNYSPVSGCTAPSSTVSSSSIYGSFVIKAYDPDNTNYGGYIANIKYSPKVMLGTSCTCYFRTNLTSSFAYSSPTNYPLSNYFPPGPNWYNPIGCGGNPLRNSEYFIVLYDNEGDSTVVAPFSIQY